VERAAVDYPFVTTELSQPLCISHAPVKGESTALEATGIAEGKVERRKLISLRAPQVMIYLCGRKKRSDTSTALQKEQRSFTGDTRKSKG
jgi:hypothetical protein